MGSQATLQPVPLVRGRPKGERPVVVVEDGRRLPGSTPEIALAGPMRSPQAPATLHQMMGSQFGTQGAGAGAGSVFGVWMAGGWGLTDHRIGAGQSQAPLTCCSSASSRMRMDFSFGKLLKIGRPRCGPANRSAMPGHRLPANLQVAMSGQWRPWGKVRGAVRDRRPGARVELTPPNWPMAPTADSPPWRRTPCGQSENCCLPRVISR